MEEVRMWQRKIFQGEEGENFNSLIWRQGWSRQERVCRVSDSKETKTKCNEIIEWGWYVCSSRSAKTSTIMKTAADSLKRLSFLCDSQGMHSCLERWITCKLGRVMSWTVSLQNSYVGVLTPSTSESDLIWNQGCCSCNWLRRGHIGIGWVTNPTGLLSFKKGKVKDRYTQENIV